MVGSATPTTYLLKGIPLYNEIATRSDINCYLIGDYDTEISGRYPHITYLGKMGHEKVIQWLSSAKIYCQVSYTESYGVAVMEAMACGCIPVVSDKDNLGDSVKGNKFAVCSNDIEKILVGINTILACAKDSDCIDMINLTKMKIHYACAERKFGLAGLVRRYT
jgi:glycosyltransferase involved in cell wall biosynthesis